MEWVLLEKEKVKKLIGCWNAMDGSSAREPGISAAGQESESKLSFGGGADYEIETVSLLQRNEYKT